MLCLNISDITITIKGIHYPCIIHDISKSDPLQLLKNSALDDHRYTSNAFQRKQY